MLGEGGDGAVEMVAGIGEAAARVLAVGAGVSLLAVCFLGVVGLDLDKAGLVEVVLVVEVRRPFLATNSCPHSGQVAVRLCTTAPQLHCFVRAPVVLICGTAGMAGGRSISCCNHALCRS